MMAVLLVGIVATVVAGDRAGIGIAEFAPRDLAHSHTPIRITFSEPMETASAEAALVISPDTPGKVTWTGNQLSFTPDVAWSPSTSYSVTVKQGAVSQSGRSLLSDVEWTFGVDTPKVIYLAPAAQENNLVPNLWIADPAQPDQARQLTNEPYGVVNFAPSPDGTSIAYAANVKGGTIDLFLYTIATGETRRLTQCVDAMCQAPDWNPDGVRIAYERIELNKTMQSLDQGAPRTWIVNVRDLSTAPLFAESQLLGALPHWSPSGNQIVIYDRNLGATVIFDVTTGERQQLDNYGGDTGEYRFDPTGTWLAYPRLIGVGQLFTTEMWLADFSNRTTQSLSGPDAPPVEDFTPAWNPADGTLAVSRRYLDGSGSTTRQVYVIDLKTSNAEPLFIEENYHHTAIRWSPTGDQMVMMRRPADDSDVAPDIWVYDRRAGEMREVVKDAYLPQWLP
jgi:Tol biopolymer transport system component